MAREQGRRPDRGEDLQERLHGQIVEVLLDKVREDPYPSTTHLDMIESLLHEDDVEPYADALLEKVRSDSFPSIDHLRRLMNFS